MNTEKIVRETKTIMSVSFIAGIALLVAGIFLNVMNMELIGNNKAIIGLSFIPLSIFFVYYVKFSLIRKSPQKVRSMIIHENDERISSLKNEAEAIAFKILQAMLFLAFMGYTLMFPEDVFESVGWWILMVLLFIAFISQGILLSKMMGVNDSKNEEE